jgi:hypothetical protein
VGFHHTRHPKPEFKSAILSEVEGSAVCLQCREAPWEKPGGCIDAMHNHTIGEQLLQVREAQRKQAAYELAIVLERRDPWMRKGATGSSLSYVSHSPGFGIQDLAG